MARRKRVARVYQTKKTLTMPEALKHVSYVQLTGKTTSFLVEERHSTTIETLLRDAKIGWHRRRFGDEVKFELFSTADPDAERPDKVIASFLKFFNIKENGNAQAEGSEDNS
jgi:hypothetical protein